jgi:hypothetical protein
MGFLVFYFIFSVAQATKAIAEAIFNLYFCNPYSSYMRLETNWFLVLSKTALALTPRSLHPA